MWEENATNELSFSTYFPSPHSSSSFTVLIFHHLSRIYSKNIFNWKIMNAYNKQISPDKWTKLKSCLSIKLFALLKWICKLFSVYRGICIRIHYSYVQVFKYIQITGRQEVHIVVTTKNRLVWNYHNEIIIIINT